MHLRRYLATEGKNDAWQCPDWYPLFQAAKYLNVPPWEMLEQSIYWKDKALKAMTAEYQAQKAKEPHTSTVAVGGNTP